MASPARNRRGIVTGAGSGIGRAVAERLLRERVAVTAVDIDAQRLRPLGESGCETLTLDLAEPSAWSALAAAADGCDYLVNAHGIILIKPILEIDREEWRRIQTVNAESIFFICQQCGPRLRPGGAIVNLSSSSAKLASTIEVAAYAASKTTILSITRSFAYALADRPVRVNAICPGIVDTPMQDVVHRPCVAAARHVGRGPAGRPQHGGAARPCLGAAGMRGGHLVSAVRRGGIHDRPGGQLHRRPGDLVREDEHEEAAEDPRHRPRPSRGPL